MLNSLLFGVPKQTILLISNILGKYSERGPGKSLHTENPQNLIYPLAPYVNISHSMYHRLTMLHHATHLIFKTPGWKELAQGHLQIVEQL